MSTVSVKGRENFEQALLSDLDKDGETIVSYSSRNVWFPSRENYSHKQRLIV